MPVGRTEKSIETNKLKSILTRLRFDEVFLADDPEVRDLRFDANLRVDLKDGTRYRLSLATHDDRHFLQIGSAHSLDRVEITIDTPERSSGKRPTNWAALPRSGSLTPFTAPGSTRYPASPPTRSGSPDPTSSKMPSGPTRGGSGTHAAACQPLARPNDRRKAWARPAAR